MDPDRPTRPLDAVVERLPLWAPGADAPRKLPWADPTFSERMLAEHLDQSHDRASRRSATIDSHVDWIFDHLLGGRPGKVLDLGCGPGFYTERLADLGCTCVGIDYSPASIEYAEFTALTRGLDATYRLEDLVSADLGAGHDFAMMLFGELNTFTRGEATDLLTRVQRALVSGGGLLLEAHARDAVVEFGRSPSSWYSSDDGLFSPQPHLVLTEQAWNERSAATRFRFFVVDAGTAQVQVFGQEICAYGDSEYRNLLSDAGFTDIEFHSGMGDVTDPHMVVITARKP